MVVARRRLWGLLAPPLQGLELAAGGVPLHLGLPPLTLSFLALSVIPELKLTDRGLVDVVSSRVVPLVL